MKKYLAIALLMFACNGLAMAWDCKVPGQVRVQVPTGTIGNGVGDGDGQVVVDSGFYLHLREVAHGNDYSTQFEHEHLGREQHVRRDCNGRELEVNIERGSDHQHEHEHEQLEQQAESNTDAIERVHQQQCLICDGQRGQQQQLLDYRRGTEDTSQHRDGTSGIQHCELLQGLLWWRTDCATRT